jgi:hypothetical protein
MELQTVAVTLLAVLVGAAVPVLIQLRRTLRVVEVFFATTGPRLNSTLEEASGAAAKIRAAADRIERGTAALGGLVDTAGGLINLLGRARASIRSRRSARQKRVEQGSDS